MAVLTVRAQARSRREGFSGWFGETSRLAVRAAPVDGAANAALQRSLAEARDVPRRSVRLVGGATARTNRFEVDGLGQETVDRLLERLNPK